MTELRQLHLRGALGAVRTAMHEGREHLVVPVVALMDGVIHAVNAATPERVTSATLGRAAASWNGRPLVLGHPTKDGRQCSANDPAIIASHAFGTIYNSRMQGEKLLMDAYVDPVRAEKLGGAAFIQSLRDGQQCEVSVGAFVTTDSEPGVHPNGKQYKATWLETIGDHLAFLPHGRGACSIEMGCGAHRAAMHLVTAEGLEVLGDVPGHPFHGNQYTEGGGISVVHSHANGFVTDMGKLTLKGDGAKDITLPRYGVWKKGDSGKHEVARTTDNLDEAKQHAESGKSLHDEMNRDELGVRPSKGPSLAKEADAEEQRARGGLPQDHPARGAAQGVLQIMHTDTLSHIIGGKIDLNQKAAHELGSRGLGKKGEWVGFEKAAKIHGSDSEDMGKDGNPHPQKENARGVLQIMSTEALYHAEAGRIDLNQMAKAEMANRGQDKNGKWVGFAKAAKLHGLAARKIDCPTCDGTGQVKEDDKQSDCPACGGSGVLKTAESDGNSAVEEDPMKSEKIATLTACPCSGFTSADVKVLEGFDEARLDKLIALGVERKKADDKLAELKAAAECSTCKGTGKVFGKECTDCKGTGETKVADVKAAAEAALKAAAEKVLSEEEFLKAAPESIRTLVADKKAQDEAEKVVLVAQLKTAGALTEEQLNAKQLDDLRVLAKFAKIEQPDFSGRGLPVARNAEKNDYTPPDPYEAGLKALQDKPAN